MKHEQTTLFAASDGPSAPPPGPPANPSSAPVTAEGPGQGKEIPAGKPSSAASHVGAGSGSSTITVTDSKTGSPSSPSASLPAVVGGAALILGLVLGWLIRKWWRERYPNDVITEEEQKRNRGEKRGGHPIPPEHQSPPASPTQDGGEVADLKSQVKNLQRLRAAAEEKLHSGLKSAEDKRNTEVSALQRQHAEILKAALANVEVASAQKLQRLQGEIAAATAAKDKAEAEAKEIKSEADATLARERQAHAATATALASATERAALAEDKAKTAQSAEAAAKADAAQVRSEADAKEQAFIRDACPQALRAVSPAYAEMVKDADKDSTIRLLQAQLLVWASAERTPGAPAELLYAAIARTGEQLAAVCHAKGADPVPVLRAWGEAVNAACDQKIVIGVPEVGDAYDSKTMRSLAAGKLASVSSVHGWYVRPAGFVVLTAPVR